MGVGQLVQRGSSVAARSQPDGCCWPWRSVEADAPSQIALSWLTNRPGVTAPITGAKTLAQLEENLTGADLELDADATARLDEISAPTPNDYPYGPFGEKQRGRYVDSSEQVISELS
jgi:aldo/keto reductase family protein